MEIFWSFVKEPKGFILKKDVSLRDYKSNNIDNWKMNDYIKTALLEVFEKNCKIIHTGGIYDEATTLNKTLDELYGHVKENTQLEYLLKCHSFVGENWIDFESEISRVIQALDDAMTLGTVNK